MVNSKEDAVTNRAKLAEIICAWDNNFRDLHDDKIGSLDIAELVNRIAVGFNMDALPVQRMHG